MSRELMLDMVTLWGLIFIDSKYHDQVMDHVVGMDIYIPSICLHEVLYPAYRIKSRGGREPFEGLKLFRDIRSGIMNLLENYEGIGIGRLIIIPVEARHIVEALRLLTEEDIFMFERDGTWPNIVNATVAYLWMESGIRLLTASEMLKRFGDRYGLKYTYISLSR